TEWELSNGAHVIIKPTKFKDDEILIRPASAKYRRATEAEAKKAEEEEARPSESIADLSDEEVEERLVDGNPALESVYDDELLNVLLSDMDASSAREYAAPPEALRGAPVWFLARDKNGDGQLTLLEFAPNLTPQATAMFGKLDKNADGFITVAEVTEAAQ
ncbi:MAG: hypothetical protein HUK22_00070, partial [Thermoguttaceae bacterium]|nr:hypothetical protein [Thermoguttaceae bacterium]